MNKQAKSRRNTKHTNNTNNQSKKKKKKKKEEEEEVSKRDNFFLFEPAKQKGGPCSTWVCNDTVISFLVMQAFLPIV